MKSIWEESLKIKDGRELAENITRDIVIVGGGIAGTLAAYMLSTRGKTVTLIEAQNLFNGVTSKTTAHITANQGYIYLDLYNKQSPVAAKLYLQSQFDAIEMYKTIINELKIDCDFLICDDVLFTTEKQKKLKQLYNILDYFGAPVNYCRSENLFGIKTEGSIVMQKQAMFNPIKFLNALPKKYEIFENTRIIDIDLKNKMLFTENHKIKANKIIIATNYPIVNVRGGYFLKLYKSQSYAVYTDSDYNLNALYQSDTDSGFTFRNYNNGVIIGGLDHRTGKADNNSKFDRLQNAAKEYFNINKISNFWCANDVITFDGLPIVGKFSNWHKDIYIITGFNKWGMANSMISAALIADTITGAGNKYKNLFSPQRKIFAPFALLTNLGTAVFNLIIKPILPVFKSSKNIKTDSGDIVVINGKKVAAYKNQKGELSTCKPYCPHLGCQLNFNDNSKTWDCPCHGSRFDADGKIITAPTVKNMRR